MDSAQQIFAGLDAPTLAYALLVIFAAAVVRGYSGFGFSALIVTSLTLVLPPAAVVFHNKQWGAEKKNQVDFYDTRFLGVNLDNPSFAEIARAMGAEGVTVSDLGDVGEALEKACDAQKQGKTTILEVMCTMELGDPFRRDALKKPTRLLDKYKDYTVV